MKIINFKKVNEKDSKEEKASPEKIKEKTEDTCSEFKDEAERNLAGWKRAMADYENLHKRMLTEKLSARREGIEESLSSLLVVLDYFTAAFSSVPDEIAANPWVKGVENIQKAFLDTLSGLGVQPINEINVPFDPTTHEAVEHVNDENAPAGNVLSVITNGYRLGNKTIRPAKVRISNIKVIQEKKDSSNPPTQESDAEETKPPETKNEKEAEENKLTN